MSDTEKGLARLREPFLPNEIGKLPKPYKKDSPKGHCQECGGYHGLPALHLDFVGHAAVTKRLLEVDPEWSWEPFSLTEQGLPQFDNLGGLWINLTVLGVTRVGYGDANGKTGTNAVKEVIGDALRNAGMRFGMALDLWHKGDLYEFEREQGKIESDTKSGENREPIDFAKLEKRLREFKTEKDLEAYVKSAKFVERRGTLSREDSHKVGSLITKIKNTLDKSPNKQ